ncbi:hypothetical protein MASR2M70_22410 [Bacillota bacterium]
MEKFIDYYKLLEVHYDAGQEIINAAYRCFSKIYHPDINSEKNAAEKMKLINVAYSAIGNPRRRLDYHQEWLKYNTGRVSGQLKSASADGFTRYQASKISEERMAEKALEAFFDDVIKENWEKSYQRLTDEDKQSVPIKEYMEWKSAVTNLYKLGNYKIQYFNTYHNCEYSGVSYPKILHFSVCLTEMEVFTGTVNQESTQKYVALDKGEWRVCLGYSDLRPSIRKYSYLSQSIPKVNREELLSNALDNIDPLTGMLSRKGFAGQAEREFQRSRRYGNPLTLATVEIRPGDMDEKAFSERRELLISNTAEALGANIRNTDIIGRITETAIGILFVETKVEHIKATLLRLLKLIELGEALSCEVYWALSTIDSCDVENLLVETMKNAVMIEAAIIEEKMEIETEQEEETVAAKIKRLGKYGLSDIMDFNKRGANHF